MSVVELPAARNGHLPARRINSNASRHSRAATTSNTNIVASAAVLTSEKLNRVRSNRTVNSHEWQRQAWMHYDICGELRYAARFEANSVSRATLMAAKLPETPDRPPQRVEDPDDPAAIAISRFLGGPVSQPQELARIATHLMISGISYTVMWDEGDSQFWTVLSDEEVSWTGKAWRLRIDGEDVHRSAADTVVIRNWTSHARARWEPDSPVRGLLPILSELEGLTKHVSATIDSRLAGAGVLFVPDELDFPHDPEQIPEGVDPFTFTLVQLASKAISDRDNAASLVPLIAQVSGEYLDKIKHVKFWSDLNSEAKELRDEAIRRLALGLDIPPEILLGLGDANHWTAWQIEESGIKLHIEPKLQTMCHAATVGYLHPYLKSLGIPDWDQYVCWYDVTQLKLRPNRSADAKDLHDDLLISDEARRRSAGFDESDKPSTDDMTKMLARKMISDQPQIILQIDSLPFLEAAGLNLPEIPATSAKAGANPEDGNPDADRPDNRTQPTPEDDDPTPDSPTDEPDGNPDRTERTPNPDQ